MNKVHLMVILATLSLNACGQPRRVREQPASPPPDILNTIPEAPKPLTLQGTEGVASLATQALHAYRMVKQHDWEQYVCNSRDARASWQGAHAQLGTLSAPRLIALSVPTQARNANGRFTAAEAVYEVKASASPDTPLLLSFTLNEGQNCVTLRY